MKFAGLSGMSAWVIGPINRHQWVHICSPLIDPDGDDAQVNSDIMISESYEVCDFADDLPTDKRGQ